MKAVFLFEGVVKENSITPRDIRNFIMSKEHIMKLQHWAVLNFCQKKRYSMRWKRTIRQWVIWYMGIYRSLKIYLHFLRNYSLKYMSWVIQNCKVVKMYNQKIIKKIKRCAKEGSYDELLNYIEGVQWTSKDGTYIRFFEVIRRW